MTTEPEKKTATKSVSQLEELENLRKEVKRLTSQVSKLEEDNEALTQKVAELRADARGFKPLVAELHSITDQINSAGDLRLDTSQVDELQVKLRAVMSKLRNLTN